MNPDRARLGRWLRRSQPPRGALTKALLAGAVGSITSSGLFVGAVALLVESALRPGLRAVVGVLIVIELFAFLRSPIRFSERMSAHRLGFDAVSTWRRWLMITIGKWSVRRWRTYARGDLLERALRDTDELQDLWLRFVLPAASALLTLLGGDVVIALLTPHGEWIASAALVVAIQGLGILGLVANTESLIAVDRSLRRRRGEFRAALVELGTVGPELDLLGSRAYLDFRLDGPREALAEAEARADRQRRRSTLIAPVATVVAVGALRLAAPASAPIWTVVATLLAVATLEGLSTIRVALDTAVAISAAAERLESLEGSASSADAIWPADTTLRVEHLTVREDDRVLLDDGSFVVLPRQRVAVTGPSGAGKSTLLRILAALDDADGGVVTVGATPINEFAEDVLRAHVAYVPSETGLLRGYAKDVVALGRQIVRPVQDDLRALGIVSEPTTRWTEVSRGEGQRIAVVRALAVSPDVVLLDEPTSGLGRAETNAVLELLASCGASVVVATHDEHVISWCDLVVDIAEGSLTTVQRATDGSDG